MNNTSHATNANARHVVHQYDSNIVPYKVDARWKDINTSLFSAGIINADFGVWYSSTVTRLWIRLILNLSVALEWTYRK